MIIRGDCLEVMRGMDAGGLDSMVTDPPAGIGFMGKDWDKDKGGRDAWIAWLASVMTEARRALKPGAYALVWALPRTSHWTATALEEAGWLVRDVITHHFGTGFPKSKSCLKPGSEHWILAKAPGPLQRLQIDACRVASADSASTGRKASGGKGGAGIYGDSVLYDSQSSTLGRWPANLVLSEDAAADLDAQSEGTRASKPSKSGNRGTVEQGIALGRFARNGEPCISYSDTGGASRFFYVAKPSTAERSAGLDGRNPHPTVKPIALMEWLVRLITPAGGTVLDPFAGSGTTGIACARQGFGFVGIEQCAEYADVAEKRIAAGGGVK